MSDYARLTADAERPKAPRDFTVVWNKLTPLEKDAAGVRARVEAFAESKRLDLAALEAMGTRVAVRGRGPDILLAWAFYGLLGGSRVVTAVKYRSIGDGRRSAEPGSVYLEPLVVGDRASLEWFAAESETDAARLVGLVGDVAAVLVLPAGAGTFKREWAALIPRGATVYLGHDADRAGDEGAAKAAGVLGGRTVRLRPPSGAKDWCEWKGDRDDLVRLVREAKTRVRSRVLTYDELLERYVAERSVEDAEPVRLGFGSVDADIRGISAGQVLGFAARTGVGKTWFLNSVAETFASRRDAGQVTLSLQPVGVS